LKLGLRRLVEPEVFLRDQIQFSDSAKLLESRLVSKQFKIECCRFLELLLGDYREFLLFSREGPASLSNTVFNSNGFLRSQAPKDTQFLTNFCSTQIFSLFIQSHSIYPSLLRVHQLSLSFSRFPLGLWLLPESILQGRLKAC